MFPWSRSGQEGVHQRSGWGYSLGPSLLLGYLASMRSLGPAKHSKCCQPMSKAIFRAKIYIAQSEVLILLILDPDPRSSPGLIGTFSPHPLIKYSEDIYLGGTIAHRQGSSLCAFFFDGDRLACITRSSVVLILVPYIDIGLLFLTSPLRYRLNTQSVTNGPPFPQTFVNF